MQKQTINPWTWQDRYGFSQAVLVTAPTSTLYGAGQGSVDADGLVVHEGDMAGQANATMDNVEAVLAAAGMGLADVVRYEVHTTDLASYFAEGAEHLVKRFAQVGNVPAGGIACEVTALALPTMLLEVTFTACR